MTTATPAGLAPTRKRNRPKPLGLREQAEPTLGVELLGEELEPNPVCPFDKPRGRQAPCIRSRTRPILKRLDPDRGFDWLFTQADARHDFVEAEFTARVRGTPEALAMVLRRLQGRNDRGVFRLRERGRRSWHIDTRPGAVLFAASGTVDVPDGQDLLALTLRVQLNPTRFLAHQTDPSPGAISLKPAREALRPCAETEAHLSARTLDGGDNVLIGPERVPPFCDRDPWWRGILRSYTGKVRQLIVDLLAPTISQARLERADFGPIRKAEVQFEFFHRDAISWVTTFARALAVADDASATRLWRGTEGKQNAVGAYLGLTQDIELKAYAKDAHRIRVEVVFKKSQRITQIVRRHGLSPKDTIVDRLQILRSETVKQLGKVWATIMDVTKSCDATVDMIDFMCRLNRRVPDENRRTVLSLLGNQRRLTATPPAGVASDAVCRGLVREGVLVEAGIRTRGPARYALAPSWSAMFDRLLGRSDAIATLH